MKKSMITYTLLLALTSVAFAQKPEPMNGYKIHGNIAGKYEGKVYILEKKGAETLLLDSVEVADGKYTFTGSNVEFPRMVFISDKSEQLAPFFLENGNINIQTSNPTSFWWSKQGGTINNEIFSKYRLDERYTTDSVVAEFQIQQLRDGRGDYEFENAAFKRRSKEMEQTSRSRAEAIVTKYPDEAIALYMLRDMIGHKLDADKLEKLTNSIDTKFNNHPYMLDLRNLIVAKKTGVGSTAPLFEIDDVNGKKIALANYRGKYVLLDFWASWCGPCIREIPNVKALYEKHKNNKKLVIIGISIDHKEDNWKEALKKHSMPWLQVCDLKAWNSHIALKYNVQAIPRTVLIDPFGNIAAIDLRGKELTEKIDKLLK